MTTFSGIRKPFRALFSVSIVLVLVLTMAVGIPSVSAGQCTGPYAGNEEYHVRWGDTLSHIVSLYNLISGTKIKYSAVVAANPEITNVNLIRAGSTICIPDVAPQSCGKTPLLIHWGDTLSAISVLYPTLKDIMIAAKIANPDWIFAGERILVGSLDTPPQCP